MNINIESNLICDILVVGGGGAGIKAALEAAKSGKSIILAVNALLGKSGSTFYANSPGWGIMFAQDDNDVEDFYHEILNAAGGCIDERLVCLLAEHSRECFDELVGYGLNFTLLRDLGVVTCFGQRPRGAVLVDLEQAICKLKRQIQKYKNISLMENVYISELAIKEGVLQGAVGFRKDGTAIAVNASAIVLACGGAENIYQYTYAMKRLDGYGSAYAMAARQGVRVVNLEFIQFINATVAPVKGLNYYQYVFASNPRVVNQKGEEFLKKYLSEGYTVEECLMQRASHGPFTTADNSKYFDLSIVEEWEKGNGLGATILPNAANLQSPRYTHWRSFLQRKGYALDESMTIFPHCHAFNGGVLMNKTVGTDLPGLFVCGESAGGCHGPDRMGGNSILATQVFGKLAAKKAVAYVGTRTYCLTKKDVLQAIEAGCAMCGQNKLNEKEVMHEIKKIMQMYGFLKRDVKSISKGINRLQELKGMYNPLYSLNNSNATEAFGVFNALCSAILILSAMLGRNETRGGHYRTDCPNRLDELGKMRFVTFSNNDIVSGIVS